MSKQQAYAKVLVALLEGDGMMSPGLKMAMAKMTPAERAKWKRKMRGKSAEECERMLMEAKIAPQPGDIGLRTVRGRKRKPGSPPVRKK